MPTSQRLRAEAALAASRRKHRTLTKPQAGIRGLLATKWRTERALAVAVMATPQAAKLTEAWSQEADGAALADLVARQVGGNTKAARALAKKIEAATDAYLAQVAAAGAAGALVDTGLAASAAPEAVAYLRGRGAALVTNIDEVSRSRLRTLVTNAVEQGHSPARIAKDINATMTSWAKAPSGKRSRADLVAVTETGQAYEEGRAAQAAQLVDDGHTIEGRWLTVGDSRVDQVVCYPNGAAGWIPYGEQFPSGHLHPLGHPGCRCDLLLRSV